MPAARAPSTSTLNTSPTYAASSARTFMRPRASSNTRTSGFSMPTSPESTMTLEEPREADARERLVDRSVRVRDHAQPVARAQLLERGLRTGDRLLPQVFAVVVRAQPFERRHRRPLDLGAARDVVHVAEPDVAGMRAHEVRPLEIEPRQRLGPRQTFGLGGHPVAREFVRHAPEVRRDQCPARVEQQGRDHRVSAASSFARRLAALASASVSRARFASAVASSSE